MSRPKPKASTPGDSSATGAVFDALLADIVSGNYSPGARLPSERDLATQLGASRPTVREALRRLAEWQLVRTRRGSGIVVLPVRDWSLEVLPAYLRQGVPAPGAPGMGQMLRDMMTLRTALLCNLTHIIGPRLDAAKLTPARDALERAWEARAEPQFLEADFEIYRSLLEAAGFLPALWLLNRLGSVYADIASRLTSVIGPPENYVESYHRYFAALERGDGDEAAEALRVYFDSHDSRLLAALGDMP